MMVFIDYAISLNLYIKWAVVWELWSENWGKMLDQCRSQWKTWPDELCKFIKCVFTSGRCSIQFLWMVLLIAIVRKKCWEIHWCWRWSIDYFRGEVKMLPNAKYISLGKIRSVVMEKIGCGWGAQGITSVIKYAASFYV